MRYRMGGDKEVARGAKRDLRKQELMKKTSLSRGSSSGSSVVLVVSSAASSDIYTSPC